MFALYALLLAAAPPVPDPLAARLVPLLRAHQGEAAVAVEHLDSGRLFLYHADAVLPTASLIKVCVLIEAYLQADEGKVSLRDLLTLTDADKVPGSGILTAHFSEGAKLPLRDCLRLMTAYSDNTATNLVLDRVGIRPVNARMAAWGLPQTRVNAKVFRGSTSSVDPVRTRLYGLGSTTAREMLSLFRELALGTRLRPALKQAILSHLSRNDDTAKFTRFLPPGTRVAHKDGSVSDARTDAGIVYSPAGPIAVCVLTAGNRDRRWARDNAGDVLCARVAEVAYDFFNAPK